MAPGSPPEPDDLQSQTLPIHTYQPGDLLYRIQDCRHAAPLHFGTSGNNRFDAPTGDYGVCYLAESKEGAFVETVGRKKLELGAIPRQVVEDKQIIEVELEARLEVVDFDGSNLLDLGADASIVAGRDYAASQGWSAAFASHPDEVDGLRYCARHQTRELSVAVFERWNVGGHYVARELGSIYREYPVFLAEMIDVYSLELA